MAPRPRQFKDADKIDLLIADVVSYLRKSGAAAISGSRIESTGHGLRALEFVEIGGTEYQVTAVDADGFTVNGAPVGDTWTALAPYCFHGTPLAVNEETTEITDSWQKFPAIVFFTPRRTVHHMEHGHKAKYTPDCQLFFLDEPEGSNTEAWDTALHFRQIIDKTTTQAHAFVGIMDRHPNFVHQLPDYETVAHAEWGAYVVEQGNKQHIIDARLSGTELNISPGVTYSTCGK